MIDMPDDGYSRECPNGCGYGELPYEPLILSREAEAELRKQIWDSWPFLIGFRADGEPALFVPIQAGFTEDEFSRRIAEASARYIPSCCTNFDPLTRTCVDRNRPKPGSPGVFYKAYKKLDNVTWIPKLTSGRCG